MNRLLIAGAVLLASIAPAYAQSLDDLNIQLHGYATQGGLYSNHNSWNTTDSENTSAAWSDTVVNVSAQPQPRLRIGVQARYFVLGDLGNKITLDWAQADYKFNDRIGIRAGKVKSPLGMLNEMQDIDPAQLWILLPQSMYPIASRNAMLSHFGGVLYGTLPLGERWGKLQYHGFAGQRILRGDDGYFQNLRDQGITMPNGISGHTAGGTLAWVTPIKGLTVGATEASGAPSGEANAGPYSGSLAVQRFRQMFYFGRYERSRWMFAAEYSRFLMLTNLELTGLPTTVYHDDTRPFYMMASYKATSKLTGGLYYNSTLDRGNPVSSSRYQKDWALAARWDFNSYRYTKFEQHWLDGTQIGYSLKDNPNLKPDMRLSLIKLGVSF